MSATFVFVSCENASPLISSVPKPSSSANFLNASELYQPADAVLPFSAAFPKYTPIVFAPPQNANTILLARPYPVEDPITNTFFGIPSTTLALFFTKPICSRTFSSHPIGCAVKQIKLRVFGFIIMHYGS